MEVSRRSRIDDTSTEDLFWLGRMHLLSYYRLRTELAITLLSVAAARGHEEAAWLVGHLKSGRLSFDDSPRGLAYQACYVDTHIRVWSTEAEKQVFWDLVDRAAAAGHPLALSVLAQTRYNRRSDERRRLMEQAAREGGEPFAHADLIANAHLRHRFTDAEVEHARSAALRYMCYPYAMMRTQQRYSDMAFWTLRNALCAPMFFDSAAKKLFAQICEARNHSVMYLLGKELDGYADLYSANQRVDDSRDCAEMVAYYRTVCYACRQVALYVVHHFRHRVGRDVARIIGRLVYATRGVEWDNEKRGRAARQRRKISGKN